MNIKTTPRGVLGIFLCIICFLLLLNIVGIYLRLVFGHSNVYGLVPLFDFNLEKNIPTLYSTFAFIIASALLSTIASIHKNRGSSYFGWLGLAFVFLFLSIDEFTSIHERFGPPVKEQLNPTGLFAAAWVIPYGVAVIVFVVMYLRFLLRLPKKTMILFVASGAVFVAGALGFEMLGQWYYEIYQRNNFVFSVLYTCEEFFEMLGIVMFIYALLSYMTSQFDRVTFTIDK